MRQEGLKKAAYFSLRDLGLTMQESRLDDEPKLNVRNQSKLQGFERLIKQTYYEGSSKGRLSASERIRKLYLHLRKCAKERGWEAEYEEQVNSVLPKQY